MFSQAVFQIQDYGKQSFSAWECKAPLFLESKFFDRAKDQYSAGAD